jgi:hypothetical protein
LQKPAFIINVTAYEGTFYRRKTGMHPHTNMCKVAMDMLISTISDENEPDLFCYTINPGYVSGVNPQEDSYPVSTQDGASKILYPIIQYFNGTPLPKDCIKMANYEKDKW